MTIATKDLSSLSRLLDEALALPVAERAAWLAGLSGEDAALRPMLAQLIEAEGDADAEAMPSLFDRLPAFAQAAAEQQYTQGGGETALQAMRHVGPYCLLRPLGSGGMGAVWLAERVDGGLHRAVALKLPHLGQHARQLAQRWERERDILAALEHPHIARLYDAGETEAGQPYLALEHVEGAPITQHCDRAGLSVRDRVKLFLQVLEAVQFAHSRLVVHRDLKPSNIFVGADGQVRLLDFGIAKLLDETQGHAASELTELGGAAPMTPDYASPEQILRQPIGTSSDVYSLGVVFYELIAGQRPYRLVRDTRGALEDAILATEPTRPSRLANTEAAEAAAALRAVRLPQLRRQLRGDLDNVALKALRKNPADRYVSAEAFASDLQRWLDGRPVLAHPGSRLYRARKFIVRHRLPVGAVAVALVSMAAGLGVALHQAGVAQREARKALAVQAFLVGLFREAEPARAQGREVTVRDLMARGERELQAGLQGEPELSNELSGVLVDIYDKLGNGKQALPLAEARLAQARQSFGAGSLQYGDALVSLARIRRTLGQHELALAAVNEARTVMLPYQALRPNAQADLSLDAGHSLLALMRFEEGRVGMQAALPQIEAVRGRESWDVVEIKAAIASAYAAEGAHDKAAAIMKEIQPLLDKPWPTVGLDLPALLGTMGYSQWQARRWPEAARTLERAIAEMDRLAGARNSPAIDAGRTLGMVRLDAGEFGLAADALAANSRRSEEFYGPQDGETALNLSFQVMGLLRTNRLTQAEAMARESVRIAESGSTLAASEIRGLRRRWGVALVLSSRAAEGLAVLEAIAAQEAAAGQNDVRHAATLTYRAGALNAVGRTREAVLAAQQAAAIWQAGSGPAAQVGLAKARLTEALSWLRAGEPAKAPPLIDEAARLLAQAQPAGHVDHLYPELVRARWLRATGRAEQVAQAESLERGVRERFRGISGGELPQEVPLIY
ncbi:MAG TPA: serine/threonine-protein kinase [Ideonella sp.]|nr:serine/threonine-protein kinase [Ideonella sp.]